jgi:hypothetical protein
LVLIVSKKKKVPRLAEDPRGIKRLMQEHNQSHRPKESLGHPIAASKKPQGSSRAAELIENSAGFPGIAS